MILDNLDDLNLPVKIKFTWFQKIALGCEIALAFLGFIGIILKLQSSVISSDIIVFSFLSLSALYVLFPIPLFRSKKIGGHILVYVAGFFLFVVIVGILFKIQSWEHNSEMQIIANLSLPPMIFTLLLLFVINFKDKDKRNLYLRIGLRYLIIWLILIF